VPSLTIKTIVCQDHLGTDTEDLAVSAEDSRIVANVAMPHSKLWDSSKLLL
jgi:hypothetical protein